MKRLTDEETAFFCEQLAMILEAGIPVADGLEIFSEGSGDRKMEEISKALADGMKDDSALFTAMEKSGIFPDYAVKMVRIGSVTGRLEDTLNGLSGYYAKRADLKQTVRSSVSHPLLLLAMMTVVVIVMVIKVIPMFRNIFSQFDESASAAVEDSVSFAYGLGTAVMIILLVILAVTLVAAMLMKIPKMRVKIYKLFTNFVLTRRLSEAMAIADVVDAMSVMTACGLPPEQTLELAAGLTENKKVLERIKSCEKMVLDGEYFADAIGKSGLLPPLYAHSLKVAYKSGAFEAAWNKIGERLDAECDRKIYGAVSFIEPIIIGILAVIIGAVLLAVMLPMTDIITAVG